MKIIFYTISFSILLTLCSSCSKYGRSVENALIYAGENREELEKVLKYYSSNPADSLKYKAACFLIGNMPYHVSYPANEYDQYCAELDSIYNLDINNAMKSNKADSISILYLARMHSVEDAKIITSEYLIWNIDYSFAQWDSVEYIQHLNFDEFCEYVLPYKCFEGQPINDWKEKLNTPGSELKDIYAIDELRANARKAAEAANIDYAPNIKIHDWNRFSMPYIEILDMETLGKLPYGSCKELSVLGVLNCRRFSIPVSMDYTPNWADRNSPHFWNFVHNSWRHNIAYDPFNGFEIGDYFCEDNKIAKVFRKTYEPHPLLFKAFKQTARLPTSLSDMFVKDVTDEYVRTVDISIPLSQKPKTKFVYLAVFDDNEWIPVDIGQIKNNEAKFNKVGINVLYIILSYDNTILTPVSLPFIINLKGETRFIQTNMDKTVSFRIRRKYPSFKHIYNIKQYLKYGIIEASNDPEFILKDSIADLSHNDIFAGEVTVTNPNKYRYWRIFPAHISSSDFAEFYFFDRDSDKQIKGKLFGPKVPIIDPTFDSAENIYDNNPLTYSAVYYNDTIPKYIGFDFLNPVSISKIAYIRRGDGNDICPGDNYEIYYWNNNKWNLHCNTTATTVYIDITDVPHGSLYYIKDISRGKQNRIFIYENNRIIWC